MSPYTAPRAVVRNDPRLRNFVVYQFFLFPFHVLCFPSRKPHTVGFSWLVQCWCLCSTAIKINSQHYDPISLKSCDSTSFAISSFAAKSRPVFRRVSSVSHTDKLSSQTALLESSPNSYIVWIGSRNESYSWISPVWSQFDIMNSSMSLWTENNWDCLYERAGLRFVMMAKPTFFTFYHKGRLKVLVNFCKTKRRLIPEDDDLLTHHHRSLNSVPTGHHNRPLRVTVPYAACIECDLLQMSIYGSKYVEELNIIWINNNLCIKLVINIWYVEKLVLLTCEPSRGFVYELVADKVLDDYDTIACLCLQNKWNNLHVT
jgi:hypothetical protein